MIDVPGIAIAVHREGDNVVVNVRGEVDVTGATELGGVVADLVEDGASCLILDLSEVTFLDSTGLSVLVAGRNQCLAVAGDLKLRDPSPAAWKVLNITGLDEVFSLDATEATDRSLASPPDPLSAGSS
jgi:anti-sigma B factor antagonist